MTRNLAEWADIVAELANRRLPQWRSRLKRPVEYDKTKLREIAEAARNTEILDENAALRVVESGILAHEMAWQMEWNVRQNVAHPRGNA